eukprot:366321-Chlamydomonas_euryale.AAC.9
MKAGQAETRLEHSDTATGNQGLGQLPWAAIVGAVCDITFPAPVTHALHACTARAAVCDITFPAPVPHALQCCTRDEALAALLGLCRTTH